MIILVAICAIRLAWQTLVRVSFAVNTFPSAFMWHILPWLAVRACCGRYLGGKFPWKTVITAQCAVMMRKPSSVTVFAVTAPTMLLVLACHTGTAATVSLTWLVLPRLAVAAAQCSGGGAKLPLSAPSANSSPLVAAETSGAALVTSRPRTCALLPRWAFDATRSAGDHGLVRPR